MYTVFDRLAIDDIVLHTTGHSVQRLLRSKWDDGHLWRVHELFRLVPNEPRIITVEIANTNWRGFLYLDDDSVQLHMPGELFLSGNEAADAFWIKDTAQFASQLAIEGEFVWQGAACVGHEVAAATTADLREMLEDCYAKLRIAVNGGPGKRDSSDFSSLGR